MKTMIQNTKKLTTEPQRKLRMRIASIISVTFCVVGSILTNVASATSTSGTPLKPAGRVGDSPLYGAGGFAENGMVAAGITFVREPRVAPYGTVAVFQDLYGKLWDLIEYAADHPLFQ